MLFWQEATNDLQKRLKADENEDRNSAGPKEKGKRKPGKSRSPPSKSARPITGKALKKVDNEDLDEPEVPKPPSDDEELDESWPGSASDHEGGDCSANEQEEPEAEDDGDLFKDRFQQKSQSNTGKGSGGRMEMLPPEVKKCLDKFEEKVLQSLPATLTRLLGCQDRQL